MHYRKLCKCCVPRFCRAPNLGHTAKQAFAECSKINTRQNKGTRQTRYLPCAIGESSRQISDVCRVLHIRHTANCHPRNGRPPPVTFAVCHEQALGNYNILPCVLLVCRVSGYQHTAKFFLKKSDSTLLTFLVYTYCLWYFMLTSGNFFWSICYI